MKSKIFLIILILILAFFAWQVFVTNFSGKPIEIVPNSSEDLSADNTEISEISPLAENTEGNPEENEIEPENNEKGSSQAEEISAEKEVTETEETPPEPETPNNFILNKKVSWGYSSSSGRTIDTIVLHSSYDALGSEPYDLDGLIAEYKEYGVAPHYLIDRKGNVYRLVDDKNIAYHAGVSETPDGRTGVNNFSIGIEIMNTKEDNYTSKQYSGLNDLINYLEDQYSIKYVLGHDDIAPDRKTDPWNFDWDEIESKKSIH